MNVQKMFTLQLTVIIGVIVLLELNAEKVSGIEKKEYCLRLCTCIHILQSKEDVYNGNVVIML